MKLTKTFMLIPTTVTNTVTGKFHPATRTESGYTIHYWPNISFATENEAFDHAKAAVNDVLEAANVVVEQWNMERAQ